MLGTPQEDTNGRMEEPRERREAFDEEYKQNLEYMKQIQREYQEIKNSIESWQNLLTETKDKLSKLEDRFATYDHERKDLLKITRNQEAMIQRLEDDKRIYNLRIKYVNEDAATNTNEIKSLFTEIIKENFPNIGNGSEVQINEAYRTPASYNQNRSTPRHIIIRIPEIHHKNRILKVVREKKQITYKGKLIKITADFSMQTIKSRRAWSEIFQALKENNLQPRMMYPAKLSLKINGETRYFHDKEELGEFVTTNPTLQRILKDILEREKKITRVPGIMAERPQRKGQTVE